MACGCSGRGRVRYQLTLADGTKTTKDTAAEAHAAGKASGNTFTVRPVPA